MSGLLRGMTQSASVLNSGAYSFRFLSLVFLGVKNYLAFLIFLYPVPVPKNCVIFTDCNFKSRASQVGFTSRKKILRQPAASAKKGKVSLQRRGGQRLKAVL